MLNKKPKGLDTVGTIQKLPAIHNGNKIWRHLERGYLIEMSPLKSNQFLYKKLRIWTSTEKF